MPCILLYASNTSAGTWPKLGLKKLSNSNQNSIDRSRPLAMSTSSYGVKAIQRLLVGCERVVRRKVRPQRDRPLLGLAEKVPKDSHRRAVFSARSVAHAERVEGKVSGECRQVLAERPQWKPHVVAGEAEEDPTVGPPVREIEQH